MNSENDVTTESQLASSKRFDHDLGIPHTPPDTASPPSVGADGRHDAPQHPASQIKVGKRPTLLNGKEVEVFTMTMGTETIELLPLKNWGQLDLYKWRVRGKLPGTPAGLEITVDHVKLLGETVLPKDPEGCTKLERLFGEWLAMEKESLELAKKKAQPKATSASPEAALPPEQQAMQFQVEMDREEQVHIHCVKGKERLASIGLNAPGFQSLVSQGLMRKPHTLKTGALHDWVELDGVLFSFEKGNNDTAKLLAALNASYLPAANLGSGKEVVVYANSASSTGFDIQFPAKAGGVLESRRRPLSEDSLELLQDPDHCGLLQKGLLIKLTRPTLIFKQKTAEGSERYLERCEANLVRVSDEDGDQKVIDLSQPVNYMHLNAAELTAVFNHPTINRHSRATPPPSAPIPVQPKEEKPAAQRIDPQAAIPSSQVVNATAGERGQPALSVGAPPSSPSSESPVPAILIAKQQNPTPPLPSPPIRDLAEEKVTRTVGSEAQSTATPSISPGTAVTQADQGEKPTPAIIAASEPKQPPNLWLRPILEEQPMRYDWLTCLVYGRIAARVGDSREGKLTGETCWYIKLSDAEDPSDPGFQGIFLSAKGGFGFLSKGHLVRFENGSVSIGLKESALTGAGVRLLAVGMDIEGRFVFIVSDEYQSRFGTPKSRAAEELVHLKEEGAVVMSIKDCLESAVPLEFVWTAPAVQADPTNPQATETTRQRGGE
ncbi:MAG TPA: hypothetical protein VJA21_15675 [Verrucomicrobiae bacterium]